MWAFDSWIYHTLPATGDGDAAVQKSEAEFARVVGVGYCEPVSDEVGERLRIDGSGDRFELARVATECDCDGTDENVGRRFPNTVPRYPRVVGTVRFVAVYCSVADGSDSLEFVGGPLGIHTYECVGC